MCGIAGVITSEKMKGSHDRRSFMAQALILNSLRGMDSSGTFYVNWKDPKECGYFKTAESGFEFVSRKEYNKIEQRVDEFTFWVSHNRASTVGKTSVDNAHPFFEDPITLVHNGTLDSMWSLPSGSMFQLNEKRKNEDKIEVDSHLLCHNFATSPAEEVIGSIKGAFALVWHDARDGNLRIIRNARRPLHIAADLDHGTLYFMSEAEMLWTITKRANINIGKIFQPDSGVLLTFKPGNIRPTAKKIPLDTVKCGGSSWTYPARGQDNSAPFTEARGTAHIGTGTSPSGTTSLNKGKETVFLGGKLRHIPMLAQDMLLEQNLVIEDRILMRPIDFITNLPSDKYGMVIGAASTKETGNLTCLIHNIERTQWELFHTHQWAVRPVGVRYQTAKEPFILCRVVSLRDDAAKIVFQADPRPTLVQGPAHTRISKEEFLKLTENGCFECGKPISVAHSSDIVWVVNDTKPICVSCQQDWKEHGIITREDNLRKGL